MGYELIDSKWTLKPTKKREKKSASKEKAPSGSRSAKRSLTPELEGSGINFSGIISQILDSMQLLHTKVDNMAFCLLFVEKNLRNLTKEVRKGKIPMEEDDSEKEEEEDEDNQEEEGEKEAEQTEKEAEQEEKKEEKGNQEKNDSDSSDLGGDEDLSETEFDESPTLIRKSGHEYALRQKMHNLI